MTSVTHPALSGTIVASQLDTNFSDVVNLVSSVGNDQLAGGITADKISDRYTISHDTITVVPSLKTTDGSGTDSLDDLVTSTRLWAFSGGAVSVDAYEWQPILKSGMEAYLCSISIYVRVVENDPIIRFYLNGTSSTGSLVGGSGVTLLADGTTYTLANTDPIANPLLAISNGDFININLFANGAASSMKGLYVTFGVKYVLQG